MTTSTLLKLISEIELAHGPLEVRLINKKLVSRVEVRTNSDRTGKETSGHYVALLPGVADLGDLYG